MAPHPFQKKPKLVYIYPNRSSFVVKDAAIFSNDYEVIELPFDIKWKPLLPFYLLRQALLLLIYRWQSRIFIVQFGGYHSLLPTLIARCSRAKSAVVIGGYDAVAIPQIGYGAFANRWMKHAVAWSYRLTDRLIPVHDSLIQDTVIYGTSKPELRGIRAYVKNLKTPSTTVFNGYDSNDVFHANDRDEYDKRVITIAAGCAEDRRKILKGVDVFLEAAEISKDFEWIIVGDVLKDVPQNVKCYAALPQTKLAELLRTSSVVVQASLSEGFPNALCEAMMCGCVPVVSPVAAMPEIAGGFGEILKNKSARELSEAVGRAHQMASASHALKMKDHLMRNFSLEKRKLALLKIIADLL